MTVRPLSRSALILLPLVLAACAAADSAPIAEPLAAPLRTPGAIVEVSTGREDASSDALAARLAETDVVILGEKHDNPAHHAAQAELTRLIAMRAMPAALVFEMIRPEAEPEMVELRGSGAPGSAFGPLIGWDEWGWPDWEMYAPILDAATDTPVLGAAVPRKSVRDAMGRGAAAVFAEDLGRDAEALGVNQPLPVEIQKAMEAEQVAAHCDALPIEMAAPMVEAQRLRDAAFADAVLRGREMGDGPVILITGSGHGRVDRAVPLYLRAAAPDLSVISVAFVEITAGMGSAEAAPFDFIWYTDKYPRGDPCEAFRASHSG